MYPRRLSKEIVSSKYNLQKFFLHNKDKFYAYMIRKSILDLNNAREVSSRLQAFIKQAKWYNFIRTASPKAIKDQSASLLRVWAHQCECVLAQRLRRSQQMFCMYTRLWEERALKDLLRNLRIAVSKRGKEIMLSAVGVSAYNWDENRIPDSEFTDYINDVEYVTTLKDKTICLECDPTSRNKDKNNKGLCTCGSPGQVDPTRVYDNWVPFLEKQDLIVWRQLHPSGSYVYKVFGSYEDVTATDFLNVQVDTEYRKTWDNTAIVLEVGETDPMKESNSDIIYWEMLWPRLFTNRDYVFNRRYFVDQESKTLIIVNKSTEYPKFPKRTDTYRVEDYWSRMVIKPYTDIDKPGVEFCLTYYDNPGVNIPSSVTNWVAMRAMPEFLDKLRIAARGYKEYCQKEGVSAMCKIVKQQFEDDDEFLDFCSCNHEPILIRPKLFSFPKSKTKEGNKESNNTENREKNTESAPSIDVSPTGSSTNIKANNSYWKYLHPTYYFS